MKYETKIKYLVIISKSGLKTPFLFKNLNIFPKEPSVMQRLLYENVQVFKTKKTLLDKTFAKT